MEGIKRILAAIDFSQYSPQVLRFAVDLTQELKAQLVVVNVLNQRDVQAIEMVQREFPGQSVSSSLRPPQRSASTSSRSCSRKRGLRRWAPKS